MARFTPDKIDNYKTGGNGAFFSLANDKDFETVRLMYNDMNDVGLYSVHEIEMNGTTYWVNCLREYDQPIDDCPLCKAGSKLHVKLWVPLYIVNTGEVKVWERGRTFVSKLDSTCRRYNPLVSTVFDIERNGKKGDKETKYELIYMDKDDTKLEDLPELPKVEGSIVKILTFDQLQEYVQTGKIAELEKDKTQDRNPATDRRPSANSSQAPVRRATRARAPQEDLTEEIPF